MANYDQHLQSSRQLEQDFQNEVEQAQNAEVKSFYQKLASEQRTITNQLQNKVNTASAHNQANMQANAQQNAQANAEQNAQANAHQQNAQQQNAQAKRNTNDDKNA